MLAASALIRGLPPAAGGTHRGHGDTPAPPPSHPPTGGATASPGVACGPGGLGGVQLDEEPCGTEGGVAGRGGGTGPNCPHPYGAWWWQRVAPGGWQQGTGTPPCATRHHPETGPRGAGGLCGEALGLGVSPSPRCPPPVLTGGLGVQRVPLGAAHLAGQEELAALAPVHAPVQQHHGAQRHGAAGTARGHGWGGDTRGGDTPTHTPPPSPCPRGATHARKSMLSCAVITTPAASRAHVPSVVSMMLAMAPPCVKLRGWGRGWGREGTGGDGRGREGWDGAGGDRTGRDGMGWSRRGQEGAGGDTRRWHRWHVPGGPLEVRPRLAEAERAAAGAVQEGDVLEAGALRVQVAHEQPRPPALPHRYRGHGDSEGMGTGGCCPLPPPPRPARASPGKWSRTLR